jgi:cell division septation protein DedD
MDNGSLRNMDDIQESDDESRGVPRGVTAALVALGAACIGFAAMALGGHSSKDAVKKVDPLGDLVTQKGKSASGPGKAADLTTNEVTFPGILSDENNPTTALAAVKPNGSQSTAALPPPPAPSDKLPVVPVPAQNVLQATPVVTRPRDALTKTAADSAQITIAPAATAPAGHEGGYQLQVSSFRTQAEADGFADQLRARGHKAYVVQANVPGRGTWFRVRVGPFTTQHAAAAYRTQFESKEHVVPFIVPPKGAKE